MEKRSSQMTTSQKGLLVDYYMGAYGPTLRFDATTPEDLALIRETIGALLTGRSKEIDISSDPRFSLSRFAFLKLRIGKSGDEKHLRKLESAQGKGFVWELDSDGWRDCLDLIEGLFEGGPGHQYLTREGVDDALVELAYKEGTPPRP
jgi:hypothetical protein